MVVAIVVDGDVEVKWSTSTERCLYRGLHYMTQLALPWPQIGEEKGMRSQSMQLDFK